MQPLEIIVGALLVLVAVACIIGAVGNESVSLIGLAVVAGLAAAYLINHGWHGENAKFAHKHAVIVRDLGAQGFKIEPANVYTRGNQFTSSTEVDIAAGGCLWPFITAKDAHGVWHIAVTTGTKDAVKNLTPAGVEGLAQACR